MSESESKLPKVRLGKLSDFSPQTSNANKHTERGLRMLDDAMSEDGYVAPMTATADNEVIDGSARLERAFDKFDGSAIILEHDGTRPIITVRTDIANAQTKEAKRIALRANRIAEADLEWDCSVLAGLKEDGVTENLFTEKEWNLLVPEEAGSADADVDPNRADELQEKWKVSQGEIIRIGRHRLMCGNSTTAADVARLMGDARLQAVVTDPPYNVGFDYDGPYKGEDKKNPEDYGRLIKGFLSNCYSFVDDGSPFFVWQAQLNVGHFHQWFADYEWRLFASCKNFIQARPTWLNYAWDPVVVWTKGERKNKNHVGIRDWHLATTSITVQTEDRSISGIHPCPRPMDAVQYIIEAHTDPGCIIYDAFAGSGTTLVASENLNRTCRTIELSPEYCAVILERMTRAFPGITIEREKAPA